MSSEWSSFKKYTEFDTYFKNKGFVYFRGSYINPKYTQVRLYDGNSVEFGYISDKGKFVAHRLDGPAVLFSPLFVKNYNLNRDTCWFINDFEVTDEITKWAKENDIDLDNLTDVDKALIKLVWVNYGK